MSFKSFEFSAFEAEGKPIIFSKYFDLDLFEEFLQKHWENRNFLFHDESEDETTQQYLSIERNNTIFAKDYIGSIYYENTTFSIFPKIFSNQKQFYLNDVKAEIDNNTFIAKLLSYSDVFKFPFFDYETEPFGVFNLIEFIIYVFSKQLSSLLKNHPYVIYEDRFFIESQVKGRILIKDYAKNSFSRGNLHQIPFQTQSFERNNTFNQIIKRCLTILISVSNNQQNIKQIQNCLHSMSEIDDIPLNYSACDQINLSKNYQDYSNILSLAKVILKNESLTMELGLKKGFCFLFKTSELFEKSVANIIQNLFPSDFIVDTQFSDDNIGEWFENNQSKGFHFKTRYDLQVKHNNNYAIIDTKYKETNLGLISPKSINQNDIYQLITYGLIKPTKNLYIIYPSYKNEDFISSTSELRVNNSIIKIQFIKVPIIDKDYDEISVFLKNKIKLI